jgi:hypothetical protein
MAGLEGLAVFLVLLYAVLRLGWLGMLFGYGATGLRCWPRLRPATPN